MKDGVLRMTTVKETVYARIIPHRAGRIQMRTNWKCWALGFGFPLGDTMAVLMIGPYRFLFMSHAGWGEPERDQ